MNVSEIPQPHSVSFSRAVFGRPEVEPWSVVLDGGLCVSVAELSDIRSIAALIPVPGYVFSSHTDWIRGVSQENAEMILVLNEGRIREMLEADAPDIQV